MCKKHCVMVLRAMAVSSLIFTSTTMQAVEMDAHWRAELARVSQLRIFFGHQSVGANLLDGVDQLSRKAGIAIRILDAPSASDVGPGTIGHSFIAENRQPYLKLEAFEKAMSSNHAEVDIALIKFCYLDIDANTDVTALFARYRAVIERLKKKNPKTVFVHVTTPLTANEPGWKIFLKRLTGRSPTGLLENARRQQYNALLRNAFALQEPIFDLARLESTDSDGTPVAFEWNGLFVPVMAAAYSDDGGHLNEVGRIRAAREFISVIAQAEPKVVH